MALNLKKSAKPAAPQATQQSAPQNAAPAPQQPAGKSWFKRGNAVQDEIKREEKRIEEKYSGLWRFHLDDPNGEAPANRPLSTKALVTFLDGALTDQGILDSFMYREHHVFLNNEWMDLPCTGEQEPCPICENGDDPSLVGVFTVIDHREFKGKKGITKDRKKLFVAKRGTLKSLQEYATPRGGIAGWTVQISRVGEKSPKVGDVFDFQKHTDLAALRKQYIKVDEKTKKAESIAVPADYLKEIKYYSAAELRKMGFGKGSPVGSESGPKDVGPATSSVATQLG